MKTSEKYRILIITRDGHVAQIVDSILTTYLNTVEVEIWISDHTIELPFWEGKELLIIDSEKLIDEKDLFWKNYLIKNPERLVLLLMSRGALQDVKEILDELDKEKVKCTIDFIMADNYSFDLKYLMIKAYIEQLALQKLQIEES